MGAALLTSLLGLFLFDACRHSFLHDWRGKINDGTEPSADAAAGVGPERPQAYTRRNTLVGANT